MAIFWYYWVITTILTAVFFFWFGVRLARAGVEAQARYVFRNDPEVFAKIYRIIWHRDLHG